jgi:hypothetical protein
VLNALFWKVFLPVFVVWNLAHEYVLPISPQAAQAMGVGEYPRPLVATADLAALVPLFIALYWQGSGALRPSGPPNMGGRDATR